MLSLTTRLGVFFRSFFIQTVWNFERMQQVGLAYLLWPLVKNIFQERVIQQEIISRHLESYNSHPYLAPLIAGVLIAKEEKGAEVEEISRTKSILAASLAAKGDSFFWALYRPFTGLLGVIITFFAFLSGKLIIATGIIFFLCAYNAVHFWVKWAGFKQGYLLQEMVVEWVKQIHLQRIMNLLRLSGLVLLGVVTGSLICLPQIEAQAGLIWIGSLGLIPIFVIALRRRISPFHLFIFLLLLGSFLVYLQS